MNKLVKIEELQEGDEIIISGHSSLKYMKVLKKPVISKIKKNWITNLPEFAAVRCSIRQDRVQSTYHEDHFYKNYIFEQDISKHNHKSCPSGNNCHTKIVLYVQP